VNRLLREGLARSGVAPARPREARAVSAHMGGLAERGVAPGRACLGGPRRV